MADSQTDLRHRGTVARLASAAMAFVFVAAGLALALIALGTAALNIAPVRQGLLHYALGLIETGETEVEIGDIDGDWPRRLIIEDLRVSDAEGTWLTLAHAELDWLPLALWGGEVHVTRLDATGLSVTRAPGGTETAETEPEDGFALPSLPSLPVDVRLDGFSLKETVLGEALAGERVAFDADGRAALTGGTSELRLTAARTDATPGRIDAFLSHDAGAERGKLTLEIEDGAAGTPGIAAKLLGIDGLQRLALKAEGTSRAGLMRGTLSLDGGRAIGADIAAHGALSEGTSLTVKGTAAGTLVARELDFAGQPDSVTFAAEITPTGDGVHVVDVAALEAGELALTGTVRVAERFDRGYDIKGEGRFQGLDRLVELDAETFLKEVGWRIDGRSNAELDSFEIGEAAVETKAGDVSFSGAAMTTDGFALTGEGRAEITDLQPVGDILGQPMRGTARLAFDDIALDGGAGGIDLTIETGRIETGNAELDALLADGLSGQGRIEFGNGKAVSVTGLTASAGEMLDLEGDFTLGTDNSAQGEARIAMADVSALTGGGASGALEATAALDGTLSKPDLTLEARLTDGSLGGLDAREAVLDAKLSDGKGPIAFRLSGESGRATLDTDLTLPPEGGARLDAIEADFFGARLSGAILVSPDGLATGSLSGKRVALQPVGELAGVPMEGRADVEIKLDGSGGEQDARLEVAARQIDLDINGPATLDRVKASARLTDATGDAALEATFSVEGGGTGNTRFTGIKAVAKGPLDKLAISAGIYGERLTVKAQPVMLDIDATYEPSRVTLSTFDATIGEATARLGAPVTLELRDGLTRVKTLDVAFGSTSGAGRLTGEIAIRPRDADLAVEISKLPLELLSPLLPVDAMAGTMSGEADLDTGGGTGKARLRFDGATLAEAGLDIRPAFDATLNADWAKRRLALTAKARGVSEEPFLLDATLPLIRDPQGAWPMLPERGSVEARLTWAGPVASLMALVDLPGQRVTGDAKVAVSADGDISAPLVSGEATIENGTFENFETGTLMRDLSLRVEGQRSEMMRFEMSARDSGQGRMTAEGTVSLAADAAPAVDVRTVFHGMQVVRRQDLVLAVEGDLALTGPALPPSLEEPLKLEGSLTTTQARFIVPERLPGGVATIDVIEVEGPGEADTVEDPEETPPLPLELDVTLAIGNPPARVSGRGIDSLWVGSVTVTGLAEDPIVNGTLTAERGTLDFAGKTFTLSRGRVIFAGERPIDPRIDVALDYERSDFSATVSVSGRGSSPKIGLSSSPSLPRDEIISRILFEKGVGELSAFEAAQLAKTAAELSGSGVGGFDILGEIQNTLGLDVLRVDQGASGGTTVSAGKYLREGVYVGVEQGALASDSGVKVEVDITDNISVDTKIGNDASSDVGINWKWDY
ncbi:translocation/assembly module TamB domain-containing protein [Parvibaculum sp.]|uniref:translocation/assembly module TamB domain-containing protein n=1 Tax=Parvibaculum sp. TaxID=2024848 RepID=UPI001B051F9E|nr:translocation/assembly module TamB domain-containing protein [Parvibaculum sp.]MBO6633253.1 translocation/assembly module TamB domain-containing protein [Parvibaculum sp.]MBO6678037.1 translocation/assembly module TamB domain-containing protein [Parvibaculum sp.]MBO6683370.1 translocation/assembly module TamB domain-containing protein [Parvibaculum sp.]MBO6904042.1 translocation/assembly module TamB domain-containing protein [Parvibaculum sp.]